MEKWRQQRGRKDVLATTLRFNSILSSAFEKGFMSYFHLHVVENVQNHSSSRIGVQSPLR